MKIDLKINKKKAMLIAIITVSILIVLLIFSTIFALITAKSSKIIAGVSVNGIKINGLTKNKAIDMIKEKKEEKLDGDIIIKADDFEYSLKLNQIETKYKVQDAVNEAYNIGRKGNIFSNNFQILKTMIKGRNIDLEYEYNEELLDNMMTDIASKVPEPVQETSYCIEDDKLIITRGKAGNSIDKEKLKNQILEAIKNNNNDLNILIDLVKTEPEDINIEKIHEEVYKEPKNAYYTKDPFKIYAHEDGIDFDVEEAKKILEEYKEEYEIKLIIKHPEITTGELGTEAFPDLLSTFSTNYDASNRNRSTNLTIAMQKLDGVVVNPGEVFSYNKTLGKRTAEAGYKEAGGFAGGRTVQMLAGGICQISSTLYDAAVYANLEIVERHNHMFLAGYVGAGKDATVVWGSCDFKFKNTRNYPIMIKTSIGSGVAKISIFGIKEEVEYEVEISTTILSYSNYSVIYEDDASLAPGQERVAQKGMNGCSSVTYKILKLNGKQVSSEVLSRDVYDPMNTIIKRGVQSQAPASSEPEPAPVEEAPQEQVAPAPAEPENEQPIQETQQNEEENPG